MITLMIHGGAWDIPDDLVEGHKTGLQKAIDIGWSILAKKGSAVDAIEETIRCMEDDPVFDAGRGSFVNAIGEIELDASIMNGSTMRAGAVAAVQNILHPVSLARLVMEKSEHVLLVGKGAMRFGLENGMRSCTIDDLLVTRELDRWREFQKKSSFATIDAFRKKMPGDTVGAVALDAKGTIVAATSTGGTPNKYPGRVGDAPLIGCGNYADSDIGGVSCSGWGESIIKVVLAKTVIDLIRERHGDAETAVHEGLSILKKKAGGYGGVIAVTKGGTPAIAFNTPRMARAYRTSEMSNSICEV